MIAALSGMTTDRKTAISNKKARTITAPMTSGRRDDR